VEAAVELVIGKISASLDPPFSFISGPRFNGKFCCSLSTALLEDVVCWESGKGFNTEG
jgi:hypothetical protein